MRPIILIFALLLALPVTAQVYKWVDEDGVVHYTDRPVEGAEEVDLPETKGTTFRRPEPVTPGPAARSSDGRDDGQEQGQAYESFRIVQPSDEETLWNIGATLEVSLSLSPALSQGHGVEVWFDGSVLESPDPTSLNFTIPEVYRGTHTLWARVVDAAGRVLIQTDEVTIYVRQTSVVNPP
ncbi:MAG: DUF4124 domain-containing protein [Gammaproteobacteria bacterium]|jgi:hypothetical protein